MLKKPTAVVLSAMLLISSIPVSASAAKMDNAESVSAPTTVAMPSDTETASGTEQTEAATDSETEKAEETTVKNKQADPSGALVGNDEAVCKLSFTYSVIDYQVTITGLSDESLTDLVIPEKIEDFPVTAIASNAFSGCSNIASITVPNSVTSIGNGAFKGTNPTKVTLPFVGESRTATGSSAVFGYIFGSTYAYWSSRPAGSIFQYSNSTDYWYFYYVPDTIKEVTISDTTQISENAFYNCAWIETIKVNSEIEFIGNRAFYNCSSLTGFDIPEKISVLNEYLFFGCKSLETFRFPTSLTQIGQNAFSGCSSLSETDLYIPNGVTSIGANAFNGCSTITSIIIPNSVTMIGAGAFKGTNPTKVTLPFIGNSPTATGNSAVFGYIFGYTYAQRNSSPAGSINQYSESTDYQYFYFIPESIKEVIITEDTRIPENAFCNCSWIEKVIVNDIEGDASVVGDNAFCNCPVMTVYVNRDTGVHTYCECNGIRHCSTKSISLESDSLVLFRSETGSISAEVILLNGKVDDAPETVWTSSNPDVATVNRYTGEITSVAPGTATITVDSEGITESAEVTVYFKIESIALNKTSAEIDIDKTETLTVIYDPENTTDEKTVTWSSSNESVAKVDADGTVTALKRGKATITAAAENGVEASCTVQVLVPITTITFESDTVSIPRATRQKVPFTITPSDTTDTCTLTSSDTDIATVDKFGNVVARKVGTAVITVTTSRGLTENCLVTVFSPAASVKLSSNSETLFVNRSVELKVELAPSDTTDKVSWSSSDESIAAVDGNGKVTALSKGVATITATADSGISADCEITVESDMGKTVVHLEYNECEYNAEDKTPEVFVSYDDERLVENIDYSLCYFDNHDAGEAGVIITSLYDGTEVTKQFTIRPLTVTALDVNCRQTMTYTGSERKGVEEITYNSLRLTEGVDYALTYKNNTDAGIATVTITGMGNFAGLTTKNYMILVKPISETNITLENVSFRYDGEPKTPSVTVSDGVRMLEEGRDYSVSYGDNLDAGDALVTVSGMGNYGGYAGKKFTIGKRSLSDAVVVPGKRLYRNDGTEHRPQVTVTVDEALLKKDADYFLEYRNNTDAGIATVVVTGIGNYIGTATETFEILMIGDVNDDGKITIADATAIQRYIADLEDFNERQIFVADTNGGGEITIDDVTQIQKYVAELIDLFAFV